MVMIEAKELLVIELYNTFKGCMTTSVTLCGRWTRHPDADKVV